MSSDRDGISPVSVVEHLDKTERNTRGNETAWHFTVERFDGERATDIRVTNEQAVDHRDAYRLARILGRCVLVRDAQKRGYEERRARREALARGEQ